MATTYQPPERAYQKYAWIILFVLGILLVVNILVVAAFISGKDDFKVDTGASWDEFAAAYPGVASGFLVEQRLSYTGAAGLALFAVTVSFFGLRQRRRWAWFAMWLLPAALTVMALLLTLSSRPDVGAFYWGFTVTAVLGLLLPIRLFFPKQA